MLYEIFIALKPLIIGSIIFFGPALVFLPLYLTGKVHSKIVEERYHKSFLGNIIKEYFYWLIKPLIAFFKLIHFTPNMITSLSFILSFLAGYFFFKGEFFWGGITLLIASSLDVVDGQVARQTNTCTKSGAFYDSCVDRYNETVSLMGIAMYYSGNLLMIAATIGAIIGSMMVSYTKARGEAVGVSTYKGLMQRAERLFIVIILACFQPFFAIFLNKYSLNPEYPIYFAMISIAVLSNLTSMVRMAVIFKDIKKKYN